MTPYKLAIIQARMSSSRLPGKVMLDIAGQPMLQHVIRRAKRASLVDQVLVATTTDPSDDVVERLCLQQELACYRGNLTDVLDRFYQAALQQHADVVIRLTGDCPLLDPDLIDLTLLAFLDQPLSRDESNIKQVMNKDASNFYPFDFAANRLPPPWQRTLPIGLDVEVCTFGALERAWRQAGELHQREHVMPYVYEGLSLQQLDRVEGGEWYRQRSTTPRGFRVVVLNHHPDYGSLRWTVDTQEDLEFVRQVYGHFEGQDGFSWQQVLALIEREPELTLINAGVMHKSAFDVDSRGKKG
jgi:spore coat polysaccharide biosynthesis protein SpsF